MPYYCHSNVCLTRLQDRGCLRKKNPDTFTFFSLLAIDSVTPFVTVRMSLASFSFSICQKQEKGLMSQNVVVISIHPKKYF